MRKQEGDIPDGAWRRGIKIGLGYFLAGIGLLLVAAFMMFWSITAAGRWVGRKINAEHKIRSGLNFLIGIERMRGFRDDMTDVVRRNAELSNVDKDVPELRKESEQLREQAKEDIQRGDFVIAVGSGVLSILLSGVSPFSLLAILVAVYGVLTTFLLTVRIVVTDILVYPNDEFIQRPNRHEKVAVRYSWNKTILRSYKTQAGTIVVGIIRRFGPEGYEISRKMFDDIADDDMSTLDFIRYIARLAGRATAANLRA